MTISVRTIWKLGGNLTCDSHLTATNLGDTNAVSVLENAQRRQLINAGVLRTDSLLLPERPLPQENEFGDVYIDDLVLFTILHFFD